MLAAAVLAAALAATACDDETLISPSAAIEGSWRLYQLEQRGTFTNVNDPERFTVRFEEGGRMVVRADCNSCSGTYRFEPNGRVDVDDAIACTRVFCSSAPFDTAFVTLLGASDRWFTEGGNLVLGSRDGSLRFRR
jgi:heat shock protein HslJ